MTAAPPTPPTQSEITAKLDTLANYQAQRDALNLQKQELIDKLITTEIKAAIAEIETEFTIKADAVNENIAFLECEVKDLVKAHGATVKGQFLQAVFSKGRTSWDTKLLEWQAIQHPEILQARTTGDPSVSLRKV